MRATSGPTMGFFAFRDASSAPVLITIVIKNKMTVFIVLQLFSRLVSAYLYSKFYAVYRFDLGLNLSN